MELRNWVGILIIIVGVFLQPFGWIYYYPAQIASFVFIFIGVGIFATQKYLDFKEEQINARYFGNPGLPGDYADNSGWGRSGESHSYQSYKSESSGGGE